MLAIPILTNKEIGHPHLAIIIFLASLLDNQKREIDRNKHLIFNLTMQSLDKIIRNLNIKTKTNKLANARHLILEESCLPYGRGQDVENGIH